MKSKAGKKKRGLLKLAITILALAAAAAGGAYAWTLSGVIPVEAEAVRLGDVEELIKDSGTVASSRVSLVAAKASYAVKEVYHQVGDAVSEGALLLTTDLRIGGEDVRSMESQAAGLNAQLEQAREAEARQLALYESGAASKSEHDAAVTAVRGLEAQLEALRHSISGARGNIQSDRVTAPADGVVTEVFVAKNDNVMAGASLMEIADLSDLYIKAELIADDAAKVSPGDRVTIPSRPDLTAQVTKIAPKASESVSDLGIAQKRVEVRVDADSAEGFILGADMDIHIVTEERAGVLVAPKKAVTSIDGSYYVYVLEGEIAELRPVKVGIKGDDAYEITEGLREGELVALSPDEALRDGSRVRVG
ncbi:MAG: efflux RND transporter periplasmic adaptor subunit [Clostridiales Family XIII bacterium]|nr:efflux RND transporter periplasmic adaptor subunit [Clostridiales Family XIII bacterium]